MTYAPPPGDPPPPPPAPPPAGSAPGDAPQGWGSYVGTPNAATLTPTQRPGAVTAAGIIMIALGALIVLVGLLFLLFGAIIGGATSQFESQMPGFTSFSGAVTGVVIVLAIILLAVGILEIVAGAQVFSGRSWARITGMVLAVILGLLGLGSLGGRDSAVFGIVWIAANAFVVWALATAGGWFGARSATHGSLAQLGLAQFPLCARCGVVALADALIRPSSLPRSARGRYRASGNSSAIDPQAGSQWNWPVKRPSTIPIW
jgi:hypothetical protein